MTPRRWLSKVYPVLIWIVVAAVTAIVVSYREQISLSETAVLWVLLCLLVFYINHALSSLKEDSGLASLPSEKEFNSLHFAKPINPLHERSNGIPREGWGVDETTHQFFWDFAEFADIVNTWLAEEDEPWRLQEMARTEMGDMDGPSYGRQYLIYYNHLATGLLQVKSGFPAYSREEPNVSATVTIHRARLFPYERVSGLHFALTHHLAQATVENWVVQRLEFTSALFRAMWQVGPNGFANSDMEMSIEGSAFGYLNARRRVQS